MNKSAILVPSICLVLTGFCNCNITAFADEEKTPDYIMDTSNIGNSDSGVLRSEQLLELGSLTPGALSIEGEQSLRQGSIDRALTVLQRSVELAPLDMDARILYAQTLEKKLSMQKKKDPKLYNFVVKQWLFVYNKSEYYDQKMLGLNSVVSLTGTKPRRFENNKKFLARVKKDESKPMETKETVATTKTQSHSWFKKKKKDEDLDLDTALSESKQQPF